MPSDDEDADAAVARSMVAPEAAMPVPVPMRIPVKRGTTAFTPGACDEDEPVISRKKKTGLHHEKMREVEPASTEDTNPRTATAVDFQVAVSVLKEAT